jgi:hypothetical protein
MADFAAAQGLLDPGGTGDLKALFAAGDYPDA